MRVVIDGPVAVKRRCAVIPTGGFFEIHGCPETILVAPPDHIDGHGKACLSGGFEPMKRAIGIAGGTNTIDEELAQ
jgi:hypothetical protein